MVSDKYTRLALSLSAITFLIHFYAVFFGGFSWFRDELYYVACTDHLSFGYVDHPPLSIWILLVFKSLFGTSLEVTRLIPAVVSALVVFTACKTAIKLGGGATSLFITAVSVTFMPVFMGMNSIYSMNSFDFLFWAVTVYLAVSLHKEPTPRMFIISGVVLGLALLNKLSAGWLAVGFFASILFSANRKWFLTPFPWLAGVIAITIFSPYIIWNVNNDFAHLEFMRNAVSMKYGGITRVDFLMGQMFMVGPLSLLVAISGLWYLFFNREGKKEQSPAVIFAVAVLILLVNSHSKPEYLGPAFPPLIAAGAVFLERAGSRAKWAGYSIRYVFPALVILAGSFAVPMTTPVLRVEDTISYLQKTGLTPPSAEGHKIEQLPQHFADMNGWEELALSVKKVYDRIPGKDTLSVLIVANNYGEASAINVLGKKYGLPYCTTEHNSYWLWGVPKESYDCYISIGDSEDDVKQYAVDPVLMGVHTSRYAIPYENGLNIWVAYRLKYPLKDLWAKAKKYI